MIQRGIYIIDAILEAKVMARWMTLPREGPVDLLEAMEYTRQIVMMQCSLETAIRELDNLEERYQRAQPKLQIVPLPQDSTYPTFQEHQALVRAQILAPYLRSPDA